jgi:alpha-beta hydrolase superfamily lysophospholipase
MRNVTRRRRALKWLTALGVVYLLLCTLIGIYLADVAVKPFRRDMPPNSLAVARAQLQSKGAEITEVSIEALDRVPLRAWLYAPRRSNGHAVLALHGVSANRRSLIGNAELMVAAGYTVLTPDARAHGTSGGTLASYGVLERDDIGRWLTWLRGRTGGAGCIHAFGNSMGAAQVLQIVDGPTPLCSAIVEAPFSTFREVAYDRVGQYIHVGDWLGRTLMRPAVEVGFITARLRYGVDLDLADPAGHLRNTRTPVLLIHGTADTNIPPRHVQFMHAANPAMLTTWIVDGARHVGAWRKEPKAYESRVLGFFATHEPARPTEITATAGTPAAAPTTAFGMTPASAH